MKTAVSLPDDLFVWADKYAHDNGLTRSALFAEALREYLRRHKKADITERMNAAIEQHGQPIDEAFVQAGKKALRKAEW